MGDAKSIVERYTPTAYAIAFRITGNQADAWDLTQNAMLRVLRSYGTYDPAYTMEQWLSRIVRNLYIDRLRAEGRRRETPLEDKGPDGERLSRAESLAEDGPRPETQAERDDEAAVVRRAVAALPPELGLPVTLVDIEGQSYDEAAKALELPISTLGVRVFRGRKMLKARLKDYWEGRA
ncbi:MAG: RNA polymerase sigma-70 factor, ECF subfamily [Elusimicrobia bacterium]|nr:MAG: RNA polymerase sigma-70 factor, ECF subfamily [Elusimicrobiota bacterium]